MAASLIRRKAPTYDDDRVAWLERQAELARAGDAAALDLDHLAEELDDMGRAERRELRSRLETLLMHLLKYEFQHAARSASWRGTIVDQRLRIRDALDESPSLKRFLERSFAEAGCYDGALARAVAETELPIDRFPDACPYTLDQALDTTFWPGPGPHPALGRPSRRRK
jgi:hypothetical protein